MKNNIKYSGVILLIAIYCFAIGIATNSIIHYDYQNTKTKEQEKFFTAVSTDLFNHTSPTERSFEYLTEYSFSNFKDPFNTLWVLNKTNEQSLAIAFVQYTFFVRNLLIRHRKANIIFPFHCFW